MEIFEGNKMIDNLVSIITPCYNGSKYIVETIESVLSQTYKNWEMIIVDDGSTDSSATVVQKYTKKDERIKYIYQDNAGSASARNNGIRNAKGRYIVLLDADDVWDAGFLTEQLSYMNKNDAVCVCSAYRMIDENSKSLSSVTTPKHIITEKDMLVRNYIGCLTGVYDSKKYGKVYLREELKSIRDDYAFWLDIVKLEGKAYGNRKVLASYRVLTSSTTGNKYKLIGKQYKFYREYLKLGRIKSFKNMFIWGMDGIRRFGGRKCMII